MKRIIIIVLGFTMVWGCKENSKQKPETPLKQSALKTDSVSRPPIKVFTIVHDSISTGNTEQLTELNNGLDRSYKEDEDIKDKAFLKRRLNSYELKRFLKMLARDFEDDSFTKATQTNVSFLTCEQDRRWESLRVIEWHFEEERTAKSCFESLTSYRERAIYFKFISWIFLQQKNKLFLVFTTDVNVDTEPMQTIKRHLIDDLEEKGEYQVVEID